MGRQAHGDGLPRQPRGRKLSAAGVPLYTNPNTRGSFLHVKQERKSMRSLRLDDEDIVDIIAEKTPAMESPVREGSQANYDNSGVNRRKQHRLRKNGNWTDEQCNCSNK
jgi:hypothetical protein